MRARRAGAFTVAVTNDARVGARRGGRRGDPARGRRRARGRGDEDVPEHARRARAACRRARRPRRRGRGRRSTGSPARWSSELPLLEREAAAIAVPFASVGRMFAIGRGPEFATAREIALKLLETCQIAAEPLTATDLAHGPVAALDPLFPVWAVATPDETLDVVVEAAARVREAGATLIASGPAADAIADAQYRLPVPKPPMPLLAPLLSVVAGPALRGRSRAREGPRPRPAARALQGHTRPLEASRRDDPGQELLRPRLLRRREDLAPAGPSSRIRPASRKQTRSAISRAKPISCVATTIVIPPVGQLADELRAPRRRARGRARSSPRRAAAASASSPARAGSRRAAAGRRRAGPGSRRAGRRGRSGRAARAPPPRPARAGASSALRGPSVTFASTVMCGKRLNAWKTIPIPRRTSFTSTPGAGDLVPVDDDPPLVDRLEQVDAAQQRRLPRAGRADQADDLVLGDRRGRSPSAPRPRRTTCGRSRGASARSCRRRPPPAAAGARGRSS